VLLRIAIGWHLLSEGMYKIMSTPEGKTALGRYFKPTEGPTFSSEGYQRGATGPFRDYFRNLIPDVDSRDEIDFEKLKEKWHAELDRVARHFGFDEKQMGLAKEELAARARVAQIWFQDPDNHDKIRKYLDNLDSLARLGDKPDKMTYEVERYYEARKSLESDRKALIAPIVGWTKILRDSWVSLASEDRLAADGPYREPMSEVQKADRITMYGLTICGLALMLGLFTPIAALGGAAFLMLFYISMPPWPGLPVPPNSEGHYVFVNKNLIEFLALLALAATPNGVWFGIDSLLFGWIGRWRYRRALRREAAGHGFSERPVVIIPQSKSR
jgi:uncharacterized membrane protein YphA (DoxX/SURF4 family)